MLASSSYSVPASGKSYPSSYTLRELLTFLETHHSLRGAVRLNIGYGLKWPTVMTYKELLSGSTFFIHPNLLNLIMDESPNAMFQNCINMKQQNESSGNLFQYSPNDSDECNDAYDMLRHWSSSWGSE